MKLLLPLFVCNSVKSVFSLDSLDSLDALEDKPGQSNTLLLSNLSTTKVSLLEILHF
ncbi:hypothetical protein DPMN_063764 [Dreissena polymorpha]|uniref:Uncharacterized protein n=1 Tax=Dreissena polymorpha TaxID=45954 RepID=A0A9D4CC72_DREPO|nr:hypothetical protein DPMN_063764 [Dreissena polymorpha]